MNSVNLIGRLTRDPEVRWSNGIEPSAIATFSIAIDRPIKRDGTKEADYPRITVFGKQAENCEKYLSKGRMVGIVGRIQTGSYTNKAGDKVYTTDIIAERVEFLDKAEQAYTPQTQEPRQTYQQQPRMAQPIGWSQVDDDDIPF